MIEISRAYLCYEKRNKIRILISHMLKFKDIISVNLLIEIIISLSAIFVIKIIKKLFQLIASLHLQIAC